ncbi:hypothetical protein, partial [Marinimicrobium locisalis]|uniref:hypothetical protein n=1 Tax=Marinimicrobium locisalis TaxID=546022 RepID=UPI003221FD44
DDYSAIASVTLTVEGESGSIQTYTAETENDFEGWSKTVSLEQGDNQIRVSAEDAQGNAIEEADVVQVRRQAFAESFPNNEVPFTDIRDMTFDKKRGRLLVPDQFKNAEGESLGQIISIDLETSKRAVFATDDASTEEDNALVFTYSITLDHEGERALLGVGTSYTARIFAIDLETGDGAVLSQSDFNSGEPTHDSVVSIVPDPKSNDHVYTLSDGDGNLLRINLSTGERTVVSSSDYGVGTGDD